MLHRRAFFAGAGALGAAMLGTLRVSVGQSAAGTRRAVRGMTLDDPDLAAYLRGVQAMRALPPSDPRNWNRFAGIHARFCPHGNWYFLPWHRAYMVTLENIVRDLAGKPDFALPYWDWTAQRQLPPPFAAGSPRTNPLNHPRPGFEPDEVLPDDMVGTQVIARILDSPDFEAFGSARPQGQTGTSPQWQRRPGARTELEFNPHDGVHGSLGGNMANVPTASRDPIFFLHHANVDRIWAMWNARGNANSPEPMWRNFAFNRNFINPDGSPWNVTVNGLQSPAALGYRYDDEAGPFAADVDFAAEAEVAGNPLGSALAVYRRMGDRMLPRANGGLQRVRAPSGGAFFMAAANNDRAGSHQQAVSVTVPLGLPLTEALRPMAPRGASGGERRMQQRVYAVLRDCDAPADPSTRVRVFVNRGGADPRAGSGDPHYATTMSFFGAGHAEHGGADHNEHIGHTVSGGAPGAASSIDLTQALSRLRGTRAFQSDRITLQLMPICPRADPRTSTVRPRRVEIAIL
jgi:tyrosinase